MSLMTKGEKADSPPHAGIQCFLTTYFSKHQNYTSAPDVVHKFIILALGRLKPENHKFKVSGPYVERPFFQTNEQIILC